MRVLFSDEYFTPEFIDVLILCMFRKCLCSLRKKLNANDLERKTPPEQVGGLKRLSMKVKYYWKINTPNRKKNPHLRSDSRQTEPAKQRDSRINSLKGKFSITAKIWLQLSPPLCAECQASFACV